MVYIGGSFQKFGSKISSQKNRKIHRRGFLLRFFFGVKFFMKNSAREVRQDHSKEVDLQLRAPVYCIFGRCKITDVRVLMT